MQIEGRLDALVAGWLAEHGSDPSEWMVTRMAEWARLETRAPKGPGEATRAALERWDAQCRAELGRSLASVWETATHPDQTEQSALFNKLPSDDDLLASAVRAVDQARSTWTRYDLARELTRRLWLDPTQPADAALAQVDHLVARALAPDNRWGVVSLAAPPAFATPSSLRRASDDTSVYAVHGAERYTTNAGLAIERRLLAAARDTTGSRLDQATVEAVLPGHGLDGDQTAAVAAVLTSGRQLDVLVGPAGTGKTTTMGAVARAWTGAGRQVLGVSIAENATRVLAGQAGIPAVNAAKLIFEHTQRPPQRRGERWWQHTYAIRPGTLVILDEPGMASRQTIDALAAICADSEAKLLLVGDPEQLPSPDAGGTFELIAEQTGAAALGQVRRFRAAWERTASLRLRAGDVTVLEEYDRRGRITGGTATEAEDAAFAAAMAGRARGLDVYLLADTNDVAARLARRVRDQLVAAGAVDDTRTVTLADGNPVGVGDQVVTRDNDRLNRSGDGRFVANRDLWTVQAINETGGLRVSRVDTDHTVDLEPDYVADRVQLAYASTIHAAQGGTRDAAHTVLTPRSTRTSAYVGLTRGRDENHAYIVCARPEGADTDGPPNDPLAVLTDILERTDPPEASAALDVQTDEATRAVSLSTLYPVWQDLLAAYGARHAANALAAIGGPDLAAATIASPAWPELAARLRRFETAGIDPAAALADAAAQHPLDGAEDLAAVCTGGSATPKPPPPTRHSRSPSSPPKAKATYSRPPARSPPSWTPAPPSSPAKSRPTRPDGSTPSVNTAATPNTTRAGWPGPGWSPATAKRSGSPPSTTPSDQPPPETGSTPTPGGPEPPRRSPTAPPTPSPRCPPSASKPSWTKPTPTSPKHPLPWPTSCATPPSPSATPTPAKGPPPPTPTPPLPAPPEPTPPASPGNSTSSNTPSTSVTAGVSPPPDSTAKPPPPKH